MIRSFEFRRTDAFKAALIVVALALNACASSGGSKSEPAAKPAPAAKPTAPAKAATPAPATTASTMVKPGAGTGAVVFFREKKFAGSAVSFKVRENGVELGKLSSGSYFVASLPVGKHAFEVHSEAKDVLNLEITAGQTYYVQGSVSFGVMVGHPNLAPSTAAEFDGMKGKLKDSAQPSK